MPLSSRTSFTLLADALSRNPVGQSPARNVGRYSEDGRDDRGLLWIDPMENVDLVYDVDHHGGDEEFADTSPGVLKELGAVAVWVVRRCQPNGGRSSCASRSPARTPKKAATSG